MVAMKRKGMNTVGMLATVIVEVKDAAGVVVATVVKHARLVTTMATLDI